MTLQSHLKSDPAIAGTKTRSDCKERKHIFQERSEEDGKPQGYLKRCKSKKPKKQNSLAQKNALTNQM